MFFFMFCLLSLTSADDSSNQKVLVLHSYHKADWTDNILDGISSIMDKREHLDLYVEYMDTKEFNHPEYLKLYHETLREKYKSVDFDVVITSDDTAWLFALKHDDDLFKNAPIVFCGVNRFNPELIKGRKVTGVIEEGDFKPTLDFVFRALPKCKRLYVICDKTKTAQINKSNLLNVLKKSFSNIKPILLEDVSYDELSEKLQHGVIGEDAAFFISFWQDNTGKLVTPAELSLVFRKGNMPIFGRSEWMINRGMTGGKCVSGFNQGQVAANLAVKILDSGGQTIPSVILDSPNQFMFDYLELVKYRLLRTPLPENSIIINKPYSITQIYLEYKVFIWILIGLLLLLLISVIILFFDTIKRRMTEKALRQSQKNLQVTLQSIGDAVITTDHLGRITNMNPIAENLTGWNISEANGKNLDKVFKIINSNTKEPVASPYTKVMESGQIVGLENHTMLISREGENYQIADSGAPIRDENSNLLGVVLVFRDVTEDYARQRELAHSQRMDSIGRLAGGVAHDFNNMLSGIVGSVDLLEHNLADADEETKDLLSIINESCEKATELTRRLLTFSRKGLERAGNRDLHKIINDALDILSRTVDRRIEITRKLKAAEHIIYCDSSQIQNAVLNLGLNSRDAMPDGGCITVETAVVEMKKDDTSQFPEIEPGKYIKLIIADTGTGIPQQTIGKIFEPFFTTKDVGKGTGLGLSAVYSTVKEHQGAIRVRNLEEKGKGTEFQIMLPLVDEPEEEIKAISSGASFKSEGCVLLIDDEDNIRYTTSKLLKNMGFEVIVAENGQEGLELFKKNKDKIVLVISDVIMPVMSGTDCLMEIRKIDTKVKVILSSGYIGDVDIDKISSTYSNGFLKKPYFRQELEEMLRLVIGEPLSK